MSSSLILLATNLCAFLAVPAWAANFLGGNSSMSTDEVESSLLAELSGSLKLSGDRIPSLEEQLRPMYNVVPKESDGTLSHPVVRYTLHRFFQQHRGWFIKGLEPAGDARNASLPAIRTMQEWVPSYLQGFLEQLIGGRGTSLRELAVFAATLEDLVHQEELSWLEESYRAMELSKDEPLSEDQLRDVLDTFMIIYMLEGNMSASTPGGVYQIRRVFDQKVKNWRETQEWIDDIVAKLFHGLKELTFEQVDQVVKVAGETYTDINDKECLRLKNELLSIESKKPGRVRLTDFYKKALTGPWEFNEKIDYLRVLGALDDTDPLTPLVIMPNYVASRPNCLTTSYFYAVCCRNECEDIMEKLEIKIGEPLADAKEVIQFISETPSQTVSAPRNLSMSLVNRLEGVAMSNAGKVPLQGRLFAQWMHHAYPRECPFPHEAGAANPMTPDEWMQETGASGSKATEEEMLEHVHTDTCRLLPHGVQCDAAGHNHALPLLSRSSGSKQVDEDMDLPWKDVEELLVTHSKLAESIPSEQASDGLPPFYRLVLFAPVMPVAFALAWYSKRPACANCGDVFDSDKSWA